MRFFCDVNFFVPSKYLNNFVTKIYLLMTKNESKFWFKIRIAYNVYQDKMWCFIFANESLFQSTKQTCGY